jgi:hypothetical protein
VARSNFPDKFERKRLAFNCGAREENWQQYLDQREKQRLDALEQRQKMQRWRMEERFQARHSERVQKEKGNLLHNPGPAPKPEMRLGGERADRPDGVARESLSRQEFRHIDRVAEERVNAGKARRLQKLDNKYENARTQLVDRAQERHIAPQRQRRMGTTPELRKTDPSSRQPDEQQQRGRGGHQSGRSQSAGKDPGQESTEETPEQRIQKKQREQREEKQRQLHRDWERSGGRGGRGY